MSTSRKRSLSQPKESPSKRQRTHEVKIVIHSGEGALIRELNRLFPTEADWPPEIDTKRLDVGDIEIHVDGALQRVIERKTPEDFIASLTSDDGQAPRFWNQRDRMLAVREEQPNIQLMYIFEGNPAVLERDYGPKLTASLFASILNSMHDYNIAVQWCASPNATLCALMIQQDSFVNHGDPRVRLNAVLSRPLAASATPAPAPGHFAVRALALVTGVSPKVAQQIVKIYPSIESLMAAYAELEDDEDAKRNLLQDIVKSGGHGKRRMRIGPKVSARVYEKFTEINTA